MSGLAIWSVIDIVALIAGLAVYLFIVGSQLKAVADDLEASAELVWQIKADAEAIAAKSGNQKPAPAGGPKGLGINRREVLAVAMAASAALLTVGSLVVITSPSAATFRKYTRLTPVREALAWRPLSSL